MQINKMKSLHPLNPYAPTWDISLGITQWMQSSKIDTIRQFMLDKEEYILSLDLNNDAGTGLTKESITTRHGKYNLFDFVEECLELKELLEFLQISYLEFVEADNTQPYFPLDIVCWFNIIRKGEKINIHRHGTTESAYLSGNMHLDRYSSSGTHYTHFDMTKDLPNLKGGLTIFPNWVAHWVDTWKEDIPRVSLAFDLYINQYPYYGCAIPTKLPFLDEQTFIRLTSS